MTTKKSVFGTGINDIWKLRFDKINQRETKY
jgi:4-hydroxybenzoate polyprenyltransferase